MRHLIAGLCLLGAATTPSVADDLYAKYFADVDGGRPCYARYYDATHLKSHPKQTVRRIAVDFDQSQRDDKGKNTAGDFQGGFGFMLKRSAEWYTQEMHCSTAAAHFDCFLEGDGGRFRLIPAGRGLRLEVVNGGGGTDQIVVEGSDFGEFGIPGGDDRVFILPRGERKLCEAA